MLKIVDFFMYRIDAVKLSIAYTTFVCLSVLDWLWLNMMLNDVVRDLFVD